MSPDFFNGLFEFAGGLFIILNIRQILKDKKVRGISIPATVYFALWGLWNLYYYPHLEQWFSFAGGVFLVITNFTCILLMIKYTLEEKE